jgi:hypothetical protein
MIRRGTVFSMFLLSLWAATASLAGAPEGEKSFPDLVQETTAPVQERALRGVLTIYIWKMTEAVGLSEEQAAQLFPKIHEAFRARWQSEAKRRQLLRLLERVNAAVPPPRERLDHLLAQWGENEARMHASQEEMQEAVRRVLAPMQQVKFLLFQERFQGDLTQVIADVRREQVQRRLEQQKATKER